MGTGRDRDGRAGGTGRIRPPLMGLPSVNKGACLRDPDVKLFHKYKLQTENTISTILLIKLTE